MNNNWSVGPVKFNLGDRVVVSAQAGWSNDLIGTIAYPPNVAMGLAEDHAPWDGLRRVVKGRTRMLECYWVEFDEPQHDLSDDGPYHAAEICSEYIQLLRADS